MIDEIEIKKLNETYWQEKPRYSSAELLDIFGKSEVRKILASKEKEKEVLDKEITSDLRLLYQKAIDSFSAWFWKMYLRVFKGDYLDGLEKQIKKMNWILYPPKVKLGQITDQMVQQAKQYPIVELIENKKNMATCFNHQDRRPSLNLKNNFAYCHSCGYSADSIKLFMDLNGYDFKQAVKALQ